eukprot:TRINITY_DN928_c0_g1_i2.p1 TRINITY_DN928_c0_g1~~TRINITY_DN928_c0_g1_i2.p1  ORF type:complete len:297 (+),score=69.56 TRINITY_DN928_c0_g1_i2:1046-1936(+)
MDPNPRTNLNDLDLPVTQLDEAFYGDNTNLEEPTEEVQLDFAENKYGDTTSSGNLPAPYVYQQPQIINESSSSSMNQFDQAPAKPAKFYQIEYYQFLFDIDTKQVGQRIARSLIPYPATFLELVKSNPDIYGPFWIATTLVFILAVAGNTSSYLKSAFRGQDEGGLNWEYDAQRLSVATGVIYGYLFFIPLALWAYLRFWCKIPIRFIEIIALYGYSFFVYIPVSILCIIPYVITQWLFIALAGVISTSFLLVNFFPLIKDSHLKKGLILILIMGALHVGFALTCRLYFFALFSNE